MRKSLSIKILIIALGLSLIPIAAHTLPSIPRDYPHNTSHNIECVWCHFIHEDTPWTYTPDGPIDDTYWNQACRSCHLEELSVPPTMKTHSSLQLGLKYGDADNDGLPGWSIECWECHMQHDQRQVNVYGIGTYLTTGTSTNIIANFPAPVFGVLTSQLIDTGAGWTGNQFQDMLLIIDRSLSHPFSFNYKIIENTSNTITFKEIIPLGAEKVGGGTLNTTEDYAVAYGKLIRDKIITPNSGEKVVKLFRPEGADSFADAVGNYEGVCEVCHTQTENPETGSARFRNTAHNDLHNKGLNCVQCHIHTQGFQNNCNLCHGYPPIGPPDVVDRTLVEDVLGGDGTESITEGAHFQHTNMKMFECKNCHFGSVGIGDEHNNALTITMGFSLFGGVGQGGYDGGTYDGQSGAPPEDFPIYNTISGNPTGTNITTGNALTCTNIYCHSNSDPFDNPIAYATPIWNLPDSMTCSSCHDDGGATTNLSSRHEKHISTNYYGFDCEVCHVQTATGSTTIKGEPGANNRNHVNNSKDVSFAATIAPVGSPYSNYSTPCDSTYCHSDARGGPPNVNTVAWNSSETVPHAPCDSCHSGRPDTPADTKVMKTDGHRRLVYDGSEAGDPCPECIRHYQCYFCHDDTIKDDGSLDIKSYSAHMTGSTTDATDSDAIDVVINTNWKIDEFVPLGDLPYFQDGVCYNLYCHSDGTNIHSPGPPNNAPIEVRDFPWTDPTKGCNACHGHEAGTCGVCHEDGRFDFDIEEGWLAAMPMYNNIPSINRRNTHMRHLASGFSCQDCHWLTVTGGACDDCHVGAIPTGNMGEAQHVNPVKHVNKYKDVFFVDLQGNYKADKSCESTVCHTGAEPKWGASVDDVDLVCLKCHGSYAAESDVDDFKFDNGKRAIIDMNEFETTGHGRTSGQYGSPPAGSGNPAANFPSGKQCWYCHDRTVLHSDPDNPFRLIYHDQYNKRFEKECVYCHMQGKEEECISCHDTDGFSLAPQVDDAAVLVAHSGVEWNDSCTAAVCHPTTGVDAKNPHVGGSDFWTKPQIDEIQNQYVQIGLCLKCHDDDTDGKCLQCHNSGNTELANVVQNHGDRFITNLRHYSDLTNEPPNATYWIPDGVALPGDDDWGIGNAYSTNKFELGYEPGPGYITAVSKSTSSHFGYKHYNAYEASTTVHDFDGTVSSSAPDAGELTDADHTWPARPPHAEADVVRHNGIKYLCITDHTSSAGSGPTDNEPGEDGSDWMTYWRKSGQAAGTEDQWFDATQYVAAQWRGKHVMMVDGPNAGESRLIDTNEADTLYLAKDFSNPVKFNNNYFIYSPVWKGGKFCWDCHDPHGDRNIYMISEYVSTETDGEYGIPVSTRRVDFMENGSPQNYAISENDDQGEYPLVYERICNVCHEFVDPPSPMHYTYNDGDQHRKDRICTECHKHGFIDSHASGQSCTTTDCHIYNRPVPRHTGFGLPRDCIQCHEGIVENRMNIMGQFDGKSHHVQTDDGEVTNKHCFACHWESNRVGLISRDVINDGSGDGDRSAHEGWNDVLHIGIPDAKVDLVIWEPGQRPDDAVDPMDSDRYDASPGDVVQLNGIKYTCISSHTPDPGLSDKPGVGVDWKLYWRDDGLCVACGGVPPWSEVSVAYSAPTAVTFLASELLQVDVDPARERAQIENVTPHCLGCHDYKNDETRVFDLVDVNNGDCRTPNQYAWDGISIGQKYSNPYTTPWGKYSQDEYPNVAAKDTMVKAYSAHGNAVNNEGGFSVDDIDFDNLIDGLDEDLSTSNTRAGSYNVQCYDCHSSHGSRLDGTTSSYVTFDGSYNGANLKEVGKGSGGYDITYLASGNSSGVNPYEEGAGQCFDCHENAYGSPTDPSVEPQPWGYESTFEADADKPILHYNDTERMAGIYTDKHGVRVRNPYKQALTGMGGHLKASAPIEKYSGTSNNAAPSAITIQVSGSPWAVGEWKGYYVRMISGNNFDDEHGDGWIRKIINNDLNTLYIDDPATTLVEQFAFGVEDGDGFKIVPYAKPIGGLCAPCHDPHGVSPTLGANMAYAVPLLKGTWMTSPYKEDVPPLLDDGHDNTEGFRNDHGNEAEADKPYPQKANPQPAGVWRTDRNTFIQENLSNKNSRPQFQTTGYDRIRESVSQFAGLCLMCHPQDVLADEISAPKVADADDSAQFRTLTRIHTSVKDWGDNAEHSFPCSKCHQPHSSGLGKLMVTNCLEIEHRGRNNLVEGYPGPEGWITASIPGDWWWVYGNYPMGWPNGSQSASACHGGKSPNSGSWNPEGTTIGRDKVRWPYNQKWNDVTPWTP